MSQHLEVLPEAGIVQDEPRGRQRVQHLDAARLERYRRQLDQFRSNALGNPASRSGDQEKEIG